MLVTLNDMKTYLGETTNTYDTFLTEQITVISEAVEGYCGRKFASDTYTQTFYEDEFRDKAVKDLYLFHYPVTNIDSDGIEEDGEEVPSTEWRLKGSAGIIKAVDCYWFKNHGDIVVEYTAGFTTIPAVIQQVVKSLVEEKYNKKKSGIAINFGTDVQQISIPGTINISFDYSLQSNERKNAYGMLLGNWLNTLDPYRSERVVVGSIKGSDYVV